MKIGELAQACGISVSALRYYDEHGLLVPVYIDKFTGYRYYSEGQITVCKKIVTLKDAGFSLTEIKNIIRENDSEAIRGIFKAKRAEIKKILKKLDETEKNMPGVDFMEKIKKSGDFKPVRENINIPFETDEVIIGRWEIVSGTDSKVGGKNRQIFFLPNGEWYWCYSWTKGKFLFDDGVNAYASDFAVEKRSDGLYMVIDLKSYDYIESGKTEAVTLKKLDSKRYTKDEIARKDNIDIPFEEDAKIIGKWTVFDFISSKSEFDSKKPCREQSRLFFKEIEFFPNGGCVSVYGDETIGSDMQTWTKGFVLRKWNSTACAYEIRRENGKDFLIIEWKSGDYRWGGFDTDYYVFVKE